MTDWSGTCDWGNCDSPSICIRLSREDDAGWVPVCIVHAVGATDDELAPMRDEARAAGVTLTQPQPQPDAGLRETLEAGDALLHAGGSRFSSETPRRDWFLAAKRWTEVTAALRSTPAAPQPDASPTGDTALAHAPQLAYCCKAHMAIKGDAS